MSSQPSVVVGQVHSAIAGTNSKQSPSYVSVRDASKKQLSGYLGTEITDGRVHINKLTDQDIKDLEVLLAQRGVVVLRSQHITPEEQIEFGRRFGKLHVHPAVQFKGYWPELLIVHSDANQPATAENWHADVSFLETPPKISILRIETTPETGGDTLFVNTQTAYDKLSAPLKQLAKSVKAIHSGLHVFGYSSQVAKLNELGIEVPKDGVGVSGARALINRKYEISVDSKSIEKDLPLPVEHPVVVTHPITGRSSLYINPGFTTGIVGVRKEESQAILNLFFDHIKDTHEAQIRVSWGEPNTVVLFDHRVVWHAAHNDFHPSTRTGYRVTVLGDRPYFDAEAEKKSKPDSNPNWLRVLAGEEGVRASLKSVGYTGKAKHTL